MAGMINEHASTSTEAPPTPGPMVVTAEMRRLADDMHEKVGIYLQGQIEGTIAEYKLLEHMNSITNQRYRDMKQVAENVSGKLTHLNNKYEILRSYLQQIDEVDENTRKLEDAASTLELYVSSLEKKVQNMQRGSNTP